MEISVKSSQVLKAGTGSKGEWELIKVTSEDGTGYTTFDKKAKQLTAGTVIDIGEPQIKEGKISFKSVVKVIKEGTGQKPNGDSPDKQASIETQCAVKSVMEAYISLQDTGMKTEEASQLKELWFRALDWCDARIPKRKETKSIEAALPHTGTLAAPEHFENPGQLLTACLILGVDRKGVFEVLKIKEVGEIIDLDEAYQAVKTQAA